jgi:protein gp37
MNGAYTYNTKGWPVIKGCQNGLPCAARCWASRQCHRLKDNPNQKIAEFHAGLTDERGRWTGTVKLNEAHLTDPLKWRKPQVIAVAYHGDLFLAPDDVIDRVFAVMALCPQHTFLVLTKRAGAMEKYLGMWPECRVYDCSHEIAGDIDRATEAVAKWPLPNVWLGVSVTNQADADERIPLLLQTPAAHRWVSIEPMVGPVDLGLDRWIRLPRTVMSEIPFPPVPYVSKGVYRAEANPHGALAVRTEQGELLGIKPSEFERLPKLDQVVLSGESGPGARPMHPDWARSPRDDCAAAGVPFYFKQWGNFAPCPVPVQTWIEKARAACNWHEWPDGSWSHDYGKGFAGHLLDGCEYRKLAWEVK